MKLFIVLFAILMAVLAKPTDLEYQQAAAHNGTRFIGTSGFAGTYGGTRGGAGGAVWTVWDAWALRDALNSNDPRIVVVRGHIDLTPLFTGSPGVILTVGAWTTIEGVAGSVIYCGGLKMFRVHQIIVNNIKFHNAISYANGERPNGQGGIISQVPGAWSQVDAIDLEQTVHVHIMHCDFADDPWISHTVPANMRRHDGLLDIKAASNLITVSDCIFRNHNLVSLVGHSDANGAQDRNHLRITYERNWFMGTTQRNPMVRYGEVHIYNNLYTDIIDYGIGVHTGALIYAEQNVFINTRFSWAFPDTTPNPMGYLLNVNNRFVNSQFGSVPSDQVRWTPRQYYAYTPLAVGNVEAHVRNFAGVWW